MSANGSVDPVDARRRPTASDYVTDAIVSLIEAERLQPGDRLPSVQSLAARFLVAAPTVRESLRRLQAIGMIDIRHGSGVYVRRGGRRVVLANPYPGELDPGIVLDLLDARLLIEGELAGLAALRRSAADISELEGLLAAAGRLLDGEDDAELDRCNMAFHRTVARLAGNTVLRHTIDSILDLYADEQRLILGLFGDRGRDHDEHLAVLEAIRERDAERASVTMRRHLRDVRTVLEHRLAAATTRTRRRERARTAGAEARDGRVAPMTVEGGNPSQKEGS